MQDFLLEAEKWLMKFGFDLVIAIVIFVVGKFIVKIITNLVKKLFKKRNIEESLQSFLSNIIYALLLTIVIIAAFNQVGIETASFIAVLGAAGLAIGLALQGSLSNFASGVLIILFKHFKAGDFIETAGVMGTVEEIHIFTTKLKSPDNKVLIIPNSSITSSNIINFSAKDTRRIDFVFGIGYDDNIKKAKEIIEETFANEERILKDPAPTIGVLEMGDSSINIAARPWVKTSDYWPTYFDILERIKNKFDDNNISIPFPQRDVHIYNHDNK